ncbi:related to mitochondrial protein [Rhynchosporium agropyri]|uniref:MICOS complex subunit n=2 Tax=Rhynchosporium TaxID=38037 RepID=A0A1E1MDR4_RHYSE|nr:related to mitochondrial protein [Rhynchosporium agropyri]CZT47220.1 related to mitochondrial protein [Rhynchosporium secalis]
MASRVLLRQRIVPVATGAVIAGIALFPKNTLHAEGPDVSDRVEARKPIYDDFELPAAPSSSLPPSKQTTSEPNKAASPTPTDRLAVQIRKTRLFLHSHVAATENKINELMDSALHLEDSFTSTVASLAPSPQSGEKLMPGTLYVLVAAMTGSIVSRNRNIILRGAVPLAVGIGAGWVVLPVTMRNVSDLLWKYEQRFPAIADGHIRTRESIEKAWRMARIHTRQAVDIVDDKVSGGRAVVEDWVKKGK